MTSTAVVNTALPKAEAPNPNQEIILHGKLDKVLEVFQKLNEEVAVFSEKMSFQRNVFKVRIDSCPPTELFPKWETGSIELLSLRAKVDENVKILRQRISNIQRKLDISEREWKLIERRWASEVTSWHPSTQPIGIDQRMRHVLIKLTLLNPAANKQHTSLYDYLKVVPHYISTIPVLGPWLYPEPPKRDLKAGELRVVEPLNDLIPFDTKFFQNLDRSIVDLCLLKDEVEIETLELNSTLDKNVALQIYLRTQNKLAAIVEEYKKYESTVASIQSDQKDSATSTVTKPAYKPVVAESVQEKWKLLTSTTSDIEKLLSEIKEKFKIQPSDEKSLKLVADLDPQKDLDIKQLKIVIDLWTQVMTDMRYKEPTALESYLVHYYNIKRQWDASITSHRKVKDLAVQRLKLISRDIEGTRKILEAAAKSVEDAVEQARKNLVESDNAAATPLGVVTKPIQTDDFKLLNDMMG